MSPKSGYLMMGLSLLLCGTTTAQTTERVSVSSSGMQANAESINVSMSGNGRWVVFRSDASNLVAGDAIGSSDVFVRDRANGTTELADVDSNGQPGNQGGIDCSISSDGRYVAFGSQSTNLVPGSTNGFEQVYVHDRWTGATERVSTDSSAVEADGDCYAINISPDGRFVAFVSLASNLVPGDTNDLGDVFVHDRQTGMTERISVDSNGAEADMFSAAASFFSADGRYVVFASFATNLVPGDTNGTEDVFVRDRLAGTTERVSVGAGGAEQNGEAEYCSISGDGRYVAFASAATNLVPLDTNGMWDIFVRDRQLGVTTRVSVSSSGVEANGASYSPRLTPDGRYVAFTSDASNFVPGNPSGTTHAFVHDCATGAIVQADVEGNGGLPDKWVEWAYLSISEDGRQVGFVSGATNLVQGDSNGFTDVFVHESAPAPGTAYCFGDGSGAPCPCGNSGSPFRGCQNSASTGGAWFAATGVASLGNDTLEMTAYGERSFALTVFFQGDVAIAPTFSGDGLRCVGGNLKRLYSGNASGGVITAPTTNEPSISVRSAALGDPIPTGATRYYHVYYRDPSSTYCPEPPGGTWNVSNALSVVWNP
ncbi:MAG TPA: hypothetical protein VGR31_10275 [Planctomycetota bacterium]|jgi:Tol biopolymer transport system component|nr:hypothetical protein [Planctomycetota bacterium]